MWKAGKPLTRRTAFIAAGAAVALDALTVLVTGRSPLGGEPGITDFIARLLLLAGALAVLYRLRWISSPHRLALSFLLLPALFQLHAMKVRRTGDGFFYYAYLQSFWKDGDFDFANEYAQYGIASRPDLVVPTSTGYRRNNFSVGPAILWSPFFGLAEIYGRALTALGHRVDLSGYAPYTRTRWRSAPSPTDFSPCYWCTPSLPATSLRPQLSPAPR